MTCSAQKIRKTQPYILYGEDKYKDTTTVLFGLGTATPLTRFHVVGDNTYSAFFMNGNVGVATTMPGYTLDVNGTIRSSMLSGGSGLVQYDSNGALLQFPFTGDSTQVLTGNGTFSSAFFDEDWKVVGADMYTIPSGNVGIGTIPAYKLDVSGTINSEEYLLNGLLLDAAALSGWSLQENTASATDFTGTVNYENFVIKTNNIQRFVFGKNGGMVAGKEDFSATHVVHVRSNGSNTFLNVSNYGTTGAGILLRPGGGGKYAIIHTTGSGNVQGADKLVIRTQDSVDVYVQSLNTGNLGLGGNTDPQYTLDVAGTVNASSYLQNGSPFVSGKWTETAGDISYTAGSVGIGVSSPTELLEVAGNIKAAGTITAGGLDVGYTAFDSLHVQDILRVGNTISIYGNTNEIMSNTNKISMRGIGWQNYPQSTTFSLRYYNVPPQALPVLTAEWDLITDNSNKLFFTNSITNKTVISMTENGNVGIGTTTPTAKLDILNENDGEMAFRIHRLVDQQIGAPIFHITKGTMNAAYTVMIVRDTGNVGINTFIPVTSLDVHGTAHFTDQVGIGTISPPTIMLDVYAEENTTSGFRVRATNTKIAEFLWDDTNAGATRPRLQILGSPNKINLRTTYNSGGAADLTLGTNTTPDAITIKENGQVYIGTKDITSGNHTNYKLAVDGKLVAKQMHTTVSNWSDYVLKKDYPLLLWEKQEEYFLTEGHLFGVPSEKEVLKNGINLGEMDATLLRKLEESYLYIGELKTENITLNAKLRALEERVMKLED